MIAILDIQHAGKPGKNDLGASHDLNGDGLISQGEREAELTPIYAERAREVLEAAGVTVIIERSGAYSSRHKRAAKVAAGHDGPVAYVACHLNAGGGDYGLAIADFRSDGGQRLARALSVELAKQFSRPEVGRQIRGVTGPKKNPGYPHALTWDRMPRHEGAQMWPRPWGTIAGIYDGPENLSGVCFEPLFIDSHAHLIDCVGLRRVGDSLAIDLISAVLDVALPLKALLPPPIGAIAEAADRAAINAALTAIAGALSVDPDRIEARAQVAASRGHHLVAARRAARAQRIRDRRS
jgi:hypothetical protein